MSDFIGMRTVHFGEGRAFALEADPALAGAQPDLAGPAVGKEWTTIRDEATGQPRTFLIESAEYPSLKELLEALPRQGAFVPSQGTNARTASLDRQPATTRAAFLASLPNGSDTRRLASGGRALGPRMARESPTGGRRPLISALTPAASTARPGVVLDYVTVIGSLTNYTLCSGTYYVSASCNLYGSTILEGGCVVKSASGARLNVYGPMECLTTPWHPAVFTAKDDDSLGEPISGSTGNPVGYYANIALYFYSNPSLRYLHDLRFRHCTYGVVGIAYANLDLANLQFHKCRWAMRPWNARFAVRNLLVNQCDVAFSLYHSTTNNVEHATFHDVTNLVWNPLYLAPIFLTNSLLVGVRSNVLYTGECVVNLPAGSPVFQTVGAGAHYLAENSPYRNAGTNAISPSLRADLKRLTTYPPVELTADFALDTVLSPQAPRDADREDIGYHYAPLDYVISGRTVSNATLTLTNGVAVGVYGDFGLKLVSGGSLVSEGTPVNLNRLVRYHAVQEQANTNWTGGTGWALVRDDASAAVLPQARFRFTQLALLSAGGHHFNGGSTLGLLSFQDCQFFGGRLDFANSAAGRTVALTNNLFERVTNTFGTGSDGFTLHARNNLFKDGSLALKPVSGNNWIWQENLFAGVTITTNLNPMTNGWNGYFTTPLLPAAGSSNRTLTLLDFQAGPLGNYYYPSNGASGGLTNLFNRGSRTADLAGLYHHTCTTNQLAETNSLVDLGFHYVAVDASGRPVDTDGDGLPDYLEDRDGNGTHDPWAGETDWTRSQSNPGGGPGLVIFTPLE